MDILLEKTRGNAGGPIWLFSAKTVQQIPTAVDEVNQYTINHLLPPFLLNNKWNGVPIGQWLALLVSAVVAYLLAWVTLVTLVTIAKQFWGKLRTERAQQIIGALRFPARIFFAVWIFFIINRNVGISIIARQNLSEAAVIVATVALLLLVWRLAEVLFGFSEQRLSDRGQLGRLSALLFLRRSAKFVLIAFGVIFVLDTVGIDVTTGLAALGIGGIALALGAQKTVENFVGSLTLVADQPIRVGDFCKIGEVVGTVEQIGMRSTRIRTLNRTMVIIPNGDLSAQKIENFAPRDRFLFRPVLRLRIDTTPDQIRYLLVELRTMLYAHPRVDPDPARVRLTTVGPDSLNLEFFAYAHARDFSESLEVHEDLLLRAMDIVAKSGTRLALPSQTLYMSKDEGVDEEQTREAEQRVQEWREQHDLPLPAFDEERISKLRDTITYPPEGASTNRNGQTIS